MERLALVYQTPQVESYLPGYVSVRGSHWFLKVLQDLDWNEKFPNVFSSL